MAETATTAAPHQAVSVTQIVAEIERLIAAAGTVQAGQPLPVHLGVTEFGQHIDLDGTILKSPKAGNVSAWQQLIALGVAGLTVELTGHASLHLAISVGGAAYLLAATLRKK